MLRLLTASAAGAIGGGLRVRQVLGATLPPMVVWKDPNCGCCHGWIEHMRQSGFSMMVRDVDDIVPVKLARGVPDRLWSCHTALIDRYVIEGHVPAANIRRLLDERPAAKGLAVPGMPASAPGMGPPGEPYTVLLFGVAGGDQPFAQH